MRILAEREGFEPPIGLHLCRISSAVHSTTLPPLQVSMTERSAPWSGRVLGEDGWPDKALGLRNSRCIWDAWKGWDRQTRKKPAVPCRLIEIADRKCGFAGLPERRLDGSPLLARGNAIFVLT